MPKPDPNSGDARRASARTDAERTTSYPKEMDGTPGRAGEPRTTSYPKPLNWSRGGYSYGAGGGS